MTKKDKVEKFLCALKRRAIKAKCKKQYEKVMAYVEMASHINYEYNQKYTDEDLEKLSTYIANYLKISYQSKLEQYEKDDKTVLFYDGFGFDMRGVASIYLSALLKNGYHVVYVTSKSRDREIPNIKKMLSMYHADYRLIDTSISYIKWAEDIINVTLQTQPQAMFFYTTPDDVSGTVAFSVFKDKANRYLIDLTDHAFWLGTSCNDYFCGSREMSASNQLYERHISRDKLIKLGVNLLIPVSEDHSELPFDVCRHPYIFSGGLLYKTLGDENHTYYRIIEYILDHHPKVYFLYAGSGDCTQMNKIMQKYPNRAFLVDERKDFYYLIENCLLYLNTYPMFGGMMMKYCANAKKIPLTLRHNSDSEGLLLNQTKSRIEYDTYEEMVADIDRLIDDKDYRKFREGLLENTIITEERFINNIKSVIEKQKTDYEHEFLHINTEEFRKEYYNRFELKKEKQYLVKRINMCVLKENKWMIFLCAQMYLGRLKRRIKEHD